MIHKITDILSPEQLVTARALLEGAEWVDGNVTAGHQSAQVKHNVQLDEANPAARQVGDMLLKALAVHPYFMAAALPLHVFPPLFNRYSGGQQFGSHVDNSIRQVPGSNQRIRTDLSATFFFAEPDEYEGGELCIQDTYGEQRIKLPAGSLILYPSTSLHYVTPVTKGARLCSFFWLQSMIRDDTQRSLLFDLDIGIQQLATTGGEPHPSSVRLTGVYHNLLRQWAEM
jgi:PKHD-type hydroxylase